MAEATESERETGRVGPIIFGNDDAREYLLENGEVYTFRSDERTTGDSWMRASRTGEKIADLVVDLVCHIPAPECKDLKVEWGRRSGFGGRRSWWHAIEEIHGKPQVGYVYHVTLLDEDRMVSEEVED